MFGRTALFSPRLAGVEPARTGIFVHLVRRSALGEPSKWIESTTACTSCIASGKSNLPNLAGADATR